LPNVTELSETAAGSDLQWVVDEGPRWRGVNHLALVTNDMDATVRFYHGVLGMRLVATIGNADFKHYFFDIGAGNTLAFFQWTGIEIGEFEKPAGIPPEFPAQFDHISFNLPDEAALLALRERLTEYACEVTDVVDHGFVRSIYFTDPNGIALEASWWAVDPTGRPADYADREVLFTDTHPVDAVHELQRAGDFEWTPSTQLVADDGGASVDPA
jgi:catechol 2,3-dioxygenase-like lactoylglutathione lyase family enzyme